MAGTGACGLLPNVYRDATRGTRAGTTRFPEPTDSD